MSTTADEFAAALSRGPLLLDGAGGTELQRRGVDTSLPLWSAGALLSAPQIVLDIHRDYASAGADILVANTFRTNPRTLARAGLSERGAELTRRAIELARHAASTTTGGRRVFVAASVAPVEDCYSPQLVPDLETLRCEHVQFVEWLAEARPDLLWIETMNTAREAAAAAWAANQFRRPFVVSFVAGQGGELLSGEPLEAAVDAVEPFDPLALGINCVPPVGLSALLPHLARATRRPLIAYAHIGNPEPIDGWSFSQEVSPEQYARHARDWLDRGARVVGGCCGTTPAHIRGLRDLLDARPCASV